MYNKPIITNKGFSAITYYLNNNLKLPIQRMLLSSTDYSSYDLHNFDIINFNINLATNVSTSKEKVKVEEGGIEVERYALKNYAIFTNEAVLVAFDIKAIALTCLDENGVEIILAMLTATTPYEQVQEKSTPYTFSFIMNLVFNGSDNIQVITTGDGIVTEEQLNSKTNISNYAETKAEFPVASASNVGQVWKDNSTNKTWYCAKVRSANTTYGYETITYIEGLEADMPSEGYYHSTDTDKFFKDGSEIEVDRTQSELPTPNAETVDKYYLIGTTLSLGTQTVEPDLYAWICHNLQPYISDEDIPQVQMEDGIFYVRLEEVTE